MNQRPYAIMAEFENPAAILQAANKVRAEGFRNWDVFTPFPIHGMDRAMGIKNSKVGWFSFLGGVTGYATGMLMIWYMNTVNYRLSSAANRCSARSRLFRRLMN